MCNLKETMECPVCHGDGGIESPNYDYPFMVTCGRCGGSGIVPKCEPATCNPNGGIPCKPDDSCHCQSCGDYKPVEGDEYCAMCIAAEEGNYIRLETLSGSEWAKSEGLDIHLPLGYLPPETSDRKRG